MVPALLINWDLRHGKTLKMALEGRSPRPTHEDQGWGIRVALLVPWGSREAEDPIPVHPVGCRLHRR